MKLFNNSTTNLILVALTLATIGMTLIGIIDAKDFMAVVLMVLSYKFGRSQAVTA